MDTKITQMTSRNILFVVISLIVCMVYYIPLRYLFMRSFSYDALYSYIVMIPLVSAYFIYLKRKEIFTGAGYSVSAGVVIIIVGSLLYLTGLNQGSKLNQNDYLSVTIFSAVLTWIGVFIFFFGIRAFKNAAFPLLFLLFLIPIPSLVIENIIFILQRASADVVNVMFKLTGIPFLREGWFVFHIPGISIEIAEQCSGIRSSISLFITSIIAGHIFLNTWWKKSILSIAIFPITIFKNGLRIVTISLLGAYVNPEILSGPIHKKGGIPFFILSLTVLGAILWLLRKSKKKVFPRT